MQERRSNFEYEDLLACGRGELFAEGPQLPLPPMLMFDRISEIAEVGGEYGKGLVRAELDVKQITDEIAKHPDQPQNLICSPRRI